MVVAQCRRVRQGGAGAGRQLACGVGDALASCTSKI
jgi:hypothetical protein